MVTCPNCNHENPEGATLCETCYTPLPQNSQCPNCGNPILSNATFCGQCGFNIPENINSLENLAETIVMSEFEPVTNVLPESESNLNQEIASNLESNNPLLNNNPVASPSLSKPQSVATQLQIQKGVLVNIQTDQTLELPQDLSVIHIGKDNEQIPPDLDLSGFPDSQIVSRIHADIRVEGGVFYLEDVGSANGTYVNHIPLIKGNRHRLRAGDRIAFGKEDKVSFIFQLSS